MWFTLWNSFEAYPWFLSQPSQSFWMFGCFFIASLNALAPSNPNWFSVCTKSDRDDDSLTFVVFLSHYINKDVPVLCWLSASHTMLSHLHFQSCCLFPFFKSDLFSAFCFSFSYIEGSGVSLVCSLLVLQQRLLLHHQSGHYLWFIQNFSVITIHHASVNQTRQVEIQKCCVCFECFTKCSCTFITNTIICGPQFIIESVLLIKLVFQTIQCNRDECCVWFQHFTQCNCTINSNFVIWKQRDQRMHKWWKQKHEAYCTSQAQWFWCSFSVLHKVKQFPWIQSLDLQIQPWPDEHHGCVFQFQTLQFKNTGVFLSEFIQCILNLLSTFRVEHPVFQKA